jgi:iron complex outermembrane receptor protein
MGATRRTANQATEAAIAAAPAYAGRGPRKYGWLASSSLLTGLAVLLTAGVAAGPVRAAEQAPPAPAADKDTHLSEVVVTAERQSRNLQNVPVAVTAISAEALEKRQFSDPSQIRFLASSLQANPVSQTPSNADFSVRGVGTTSFSNSTEYSVSTVLDDVVLARPELGVVQYFDLDQIEVLRGPQVALWGKNASAGVVSIRSKRPEIGVYSGSVRAQGAWTDTVGTGLSGRLEGVVNIPVSADSALRISAFGIENAPLVKNVLPNNKSNLDFKEAGAKVKYLWRPNDHFYAYAIADYARESGAGQHGFTLRSVGNGVPYPAPLAQALTASGIVPGPDNLYLNADGRYDTKYSTGGAQVEVGYHFDSGYSLTNILAWRTASMDNIGDSDLTSANYFNAVALGLRDQQWSNELRVATPSGGFVEGQAGIYLLNGRFTRDTSASGTFGNPAPPGKIFRAGSNFSTQVANSAALFGQVVLHPSDKLRLIIGGRYTYDDIKLSSTSFLDNGVTPFFPLGTLQQARTNQNLSYKVGVQYDVAPNVMAYATYTRGYKGPAFNNTASATAAVAVNPEIPVGTELGLKTSLFDRRVTVNVAAFRTTFHGFQTNSVDPATLLTVLENAGTARTQGLEVEFQAKPAAGLTVSGGLTWMQADYLSFLNSPCYAGQTVAQGCRVVQPATPATPTSPARPAVTSYDASGQPLGNAPDFTINTSIAYEHPVTDDLIGSVSVSGYYRSRANFSNNGNPYTWLGGYGTVDTDFGITSIKDKWRFKVFVHNIFDKRFPGIIQANTGAAGAYHQGFAPNSFRSIGAELTVNF